jgi:hypothetical protein
LDGKLLFSPLREIKITGSIGLVQPFQLIFFCFHLLFEIAQMLGFISKFLLAVSFLKPLDDQLRVIDDLSNGLPHRRFKLTGSDGGRIAANLFSYAFGLITANTIIGQRPSRYVDLEAWAASPVDALRFHLTPHTLRHYFATEFLSETGDLALTQYALDRASPTTTRVYTQTKREDYRRAHRSVFGGRQKDRA